MRLIRNVGVQVVLCSLLGAAFGYAFPKVGLDTKMLSDGFISVIKWFIVPLIFCTITTGIGGASQGRSIARLGLHSLIYFEVVTTLALLFGWAALTLFPIGTGLPFVLFDVNPVATPPNMEGLMNIFGAAPATLFTPLTSGAILQTLGLSVALGIGVAACGGKESALYKTLHDLRDVVFYLLDFVIRCAPIAAFGAISFTVARYGFEPLWVLGKFLAFFVTLCLVFILLVLGLIAYAYKIPLFRVLCFFSDEIIISFATGSSESVLPIVLKKVERLGVDREVAAIVVPAGYAFNLDGSCLSLTACAFFLAQITNTPFPIEQQIAFFLALLLTSKGAAAVSGSAFVILGTTLAMTTNVPMESLSIILAIDRFLSMARAPTNLCGNLCAVLVLAKKNGALDLPRMHVQLTQRNNPH